MAADEEVEDEVEDGEVEDEVEDGVVEDKVEDEEVEDEVEEFLRCVVLMNIPFFGFALYVGVTCCAAPCPRCSAGVDAPPAASCVPRSVAICEAWSSWFSACWSISMPEVSVGAVAVSVVRSEEVMRNR